MIQLTVEPLLLQPEGLVDPELAAFDAALEREFHLADLGLDIDCTENDGRPPLEETDQ